MNILGTKCQCDVCHLQVVVIKDGAGTLTCHDQPLRVLAGGVANSASGAERRSANVPADGETDEDVDFY